MVFTTGNKELDILIGEIPQKYITCCLSLGIHMLLTSSFWRAKGSPHLFGFTSVIWEVFRGTRAPHIL